MKNIASPHVRLHPRWLLPIAAAALLAMSGGWASAADASAPAASAAVAQAPLQRKMFASPEAAVEALIDAMRKDDVAALERVLGPGSVNIVYSGDAAADRESRKKFVAAYDEGHELDQSVAGRAILSVGKDDWPMPVPIVKRQSGWTFDARAGAAELVARRIGRNELDAIQVCLAFVDMERDYAELDRNGDGTLEYAARLVSTPGKHDGLYWEAKAGEPQSPAGPRLAAANPQPRAAGSPPTPFHGYYFRILTKQGASAPGGKRDYFVEGKLIGGVALLAWPARYRVSGVKTFVCSLDGTVLERDLGPQTSAKAARIVAYDPDPNWKPTK
ncbi:MAG: DUF2950 domain-containing protein [Burkholderiaceae bacterium]|nr:DUF2950 domain-containing protein [Burkholderiaceae bacterium]